MKRLTWFGWLLILAWPLASYLIAFAAVSRFGDLTGGQFLTLLLFLLALLFLAGVTLLARFGNDPVYFPPPFPPRRLYPFPAWRLALGSMLSGFLCYLLVFAVLFSTAKERSSGPPIPSSDVGQPRHWLVDDLLKQMALAPMAFNVPPKMKLDEIAEVELVVGPSQNIHDLIASLNKSTAQGAIVRITDRMEAKLSGDGFAVTPETPELRAVSLKELTRWNWEVKALKPGRHWLHLSLSAIIALEGQPIPGSVKTFDKGVEVEVTVPQWILAFARSNWQWLWTVAVVPFGGWLLRKRALRSTPPHQQRRRARTLDES